MQRFNRTDLIKRAPKLLLSALFFWGPAIAFFKIADEVREQEAIRTDSSFLKWLHSFATPQRDQIVIFITTLGDAWAVCAITTCIAIYLLFKRKWNATVFFLGSVGGAAVTNVLLKAFFHRARPSLWSPVRAEPDYSFPSGHAMLTAALALSLVYLLWATRWRWLAVSVAVIYALSVGLSRLYLGVHFPTDVLAGWCVSIIWVTVLSHITRIRQASPPTGGVPLSHSDEGGG